MREFFLSFLFCCCLNSFSQCLSFQFAEIGYEPAYCRVAGYQSGNGVVYAAATGGTEPYTYQWTNLQTGQTTNNTTWGGLNTGLYQISAHDSYGCVLIDTIEVDSINPVADFEIVSSDFDSTGMVAFLPFDGEVHPAISACYQFIYPEFIDTFTHWQFGSGSAWITKGCYDRPDFDIITEGSFEIKLVKMNGNGCTDTAAQILNAVLPTYAPFLPTVFCDYATGQVFIEIPENLNAFFVLYDLNGTIQTKISLESGMNILQVESGISFYKVISAGSSEEILRGKLIHVAP